MNKLSILSKLCEDCIKKENCGVKYDAELEDMLVSFCVHKEKDDKLLAHKTQQYKQGYNKAIDDFEALAMKKITEFDLKHGYPTVEDCQLIFMDIAEQLKSKTEF